MFIFGKRAHLARATRQTQTFSRGGGGGVPTRGSAGREQRCSDGPQPAAVSGMQPGDSLAACVALGWASAGQKQAGGCTEGSLSQRSLPAAVGGSHRVGLAGRAAVLLSLFRAGRHGSADSQRCRQPGSVSNRVKKRSCAARDLFLSGFWLVWIDGSCLSKAARLRKARSVSVSSELLFGGDFFGAVKRSVVVLLRVVDRSP